jgi:hypothetical protein
MDASARSVEVTRAPCWWRRRGRRPKRLGRCTLSSCRRAKRVHQIAAVAVTRKLTVLYWRLLTEDEDYLRVRPALVANKTRAMERPAGHPQQKGSRREPA